VEVRDLQQPLTEDGAWCFFADPRAVYYEGRFRRTYAGWITSRGDVMLGSFDHDSGDIQTVTVRESLQQDDHANPSLYIDQDGFIAIFYSAHCGPNMYYRVNSRPEDIFSLGEETVIPVNSEGNKGFTYPAPIYLQTEKKLYLFWRGGNFKPTFSICESLAENRWLPAQTFIEDRGDRPYIRYVSDGEKVIHFAFTDGHPNVEPTNSIYYAKYVQGCFFRVDGTPIHEISDRPLRTSEADLVYDGKAHARNSWIWDIALDQQGRPVLVYAVFAAENDHRYYYSRWDGREWRTTELTAGGSWFPQTPEGMKETEPYYSGGIILDHNDPNIVYLSRPSGGIFRIERWQTKDGGISWDHSFATEASAGMQIRPFVSRRTAGKPGVLFWMEGIYVHYTKYNTGINMKRI
jgi:hypothetical protein